MKSKKSKFPTAGKKERAEKHLCKSNGVRWMNSDRLNALIVQHTLTSILSHGFLFALFFHSHKTPKLYQQSFILSLSTFEIYKDVPHRTNSLHFLIHMPFYDSLNASFFSNSPSTQKYFTIDFLWWHATKKNALMKSLDPQQVHVAIKFPDFFFRRDFFFGECDLQSTTS